jgi:1-acyl-sn-glycerol-3-phosphate acyltransferase
MKLAMIGMKDESHAAEVHEEAGQDPLPLLDGPLDPLFKLYSLTVGWPVGFGLMAAAVGGSAAVLPVMPFERMQHLWPQPLMGLAGRIASYGKLEIERHPSLDPARAAMFCMNHTSMLDAHVACASIPQAFCGMQHAHHFSIPVYGWLMKIANGIGVKKGEGGQFEGVREQMLDRAARGVSVLVFPEGRRTQNGRILPFKRGVFLMARDAEMPVCVLAVRGLWGTLRRNEWVLRPGDVRAYVGPQIETRGLSDAQLDELARRMQRFTSNYVEHGILGDPLAIDPRRPADGL